MWSENLEFEVFGFGSKVDFGGNEFRVEPASIESSITTFANINDGTLTPPTVGEFKDGRGEFFNQDTLNGRSILVRFIISDITPNSCRFEQAFSADGGKTWEVNWIALDTRLKE